MVKKRIDYCNKCLSQLDRKENLMGELVEVTCPKCGVVFARCDKNGHQKDNGNP